MTSGSQRWIRGATVGITATLLALCGHTLAGGGLPPAAPVAIVLFVAVAAGIGLSGQQWTLPTLLIFLLAVQAVLHVAFAESAGPAGLMSAQHAHDSATPGLVMLAAHLLAALSTAWLLRRGEWCCWRLADLLSRPLRSARAVAAAARPAPRLPSITRCRRVTGHQLRLLTLTAPRRGPPPALAH